MATLQISSPQNPRVKAAARLRERSGRDDQGRIIIDGVREISRAIRSQVALDELFYFPQLAQDEEHQSLVAAAAQAGAALVEVTPHVMEKLAFGQRVEGVVATAQTPQRTLTHLALPREALVVVVEGAEKPGNIGAILRTADGAGVSALIVADGGTDLYNPNAIRASLGAIFTVPVCQAASDAVRDWLASRGFRLFSARVDAGREYTAADFRGSAAIVLGSEAHGLSDRWSGPDIVAIRLPMLGQIDSLNLSATAAVLCYEALRQRSGGGLSGSGRPQP